MRRRRKVEELERELRERPRDPMLLLRIAALIRRSPEPALAAPFLERAGDVFLGEQPLRAVAAYRAAVRLRPGQPALREKLAAALLRCGAAADAAEELAAAERAYALSGDVEGLARIAAALGPAGRAS